MPELPDVEVYVDRLAFFLCGASYRRLVLGSPFVLRSVDPQPRDFEGLTVEGVERLGKRIVVVLEGERFLVIHLMIAGRLQWRHGEETPPRLGARNRQAAFSFSTGTLLLTEAGSKKRASIHLVCGRRRLAEHDRGGLELLSASAEAFRTALMIENHTLKRSLTDPRLFSGIGNAYSDEILHRAQLSPLKWTNKLDDAEIERLFSACLEVLGEWSARLKAEAGDGFPKKVTAFRPEMAVHGKFGEPCPVCAAPVQRIVYAENECNYCAVCQTGGKLLRDRALSQLLKGDWPKTMQELEERRVVR